MSGARPYPDRQRRGPLKAIVKVVRRAVGGGYNQAVVELECGHLVKSNANKHARCDKCQS